MPTGPEEHYREAGRIASAWANLEFTMDLLIWNLAEVKQMLGACITTQLATTSARIRVLNALLRLRDAPEPLLKRLNKWAGTNHEMAQKRARAIHDIWLLDPEDQSAHQLRLAITQNALEFEIKPVSLPEVKDTYQAIAGHVKEFISWNNDVRIWLHSSSNKWRERLGEFGYVLPDMPNQDTDT